MSFLIRIAKYFVRTFIALLVLALGWFSYLYVYGNFHQVTPETYRSAQLFKHNMEYYLQKHNIRSIINLRGASKDASWYRYERNVSKSLGIKHYDFGISDRQVQDLQTMKRLVELMRKAPKPLLIHCKAGADRTSLASALYVYEQTKDPQKGWEQISFAYGHFPWLGSKTVAMDQSFERYINANPPTQKNP